MDDGAAAKRRQRGLLALVYVFIEDPVERQAAGVTAAAPGFSSGELPLAQPQPDPNTD